MLQPLPIIAPSFRDALRDALKDELESSSPRRLLASVVASLVDWRRERDPYLRARKWCLSVLYSRAAVVRQARMLIDQMRLGASSGTVAVAGSDNWVSGGGVYTSGGEVGDDMSWDDVYWEHEFESWKDAQEFADEMRDQGVPAHGPYPGPDGRPHVYIDEDYFSF